MADLDYVCPKCRYTEYSVSQMRATGGFWAKIFDIQNRKFTSVTCAQCTYTEFYRTSSSTLGNVFDFFTN